MYHELFTYSHRFTEPRMFRNFWRTYSGREMKGQLPDTLISIQSFEIDWDQLMKDEELKIKVDRVITNRYLQRMNYSIFKENMKRLHEAIKRELENIE